MYDRTGVLIDRREMLRVKAKSLAEEARIIRREEARLGRNNDGVLRHELCWHRRIDVRLESRMTYIAYGLIRGTPLQSIEQPKTERTDALWKRIRVMVEKYGPVDKAGKAAVLALCQG